MQSRGFMDRFGTKERTGIGGRSRQQPPHTLPTVDPPPQHTAQLRGSGNKPDADTMLLLGIGHANISGGTFRTSEVLGSSNTRAGLGAGAVRWLDFNATDGADDATFFSDVERLRQSDGAHSTESGGTNIYGTPHYVSQMREEELRRQRPSFGDAPDILLRSPLKMPQQRREPLKGRDGPATEWAMSPPRQFTHTHRQLSHAPPPPWLDDRASRRPPQGGLASPTLPQRNMPRQLEPLPTQLYTSPKSRGSMDIQSVVSAAAQHRTSPPFPGKVSPPYRKDIANLPGAVYSRPIPDVVHGILYGK